MSRKINSSSSSKFSLDEIEKRYEKRKEIQEEALKDMQQHVRDTLDKYADVDIVTRNNL